MRRRLLSLLLAFVLVLGMLPLPSYAEEIAYEVIVEEEIAEEIAEEITVEVIPQEANHRSVSAASAAPSGIAGPAGTNILSITHVTEFTPGEEIEFSMWGMFCGPVPSFVGTVPAGTKAVTLTFEEGNYPAPFEDWNTGAPSLSGGYVSYDAENDAYTGSGASHSPIAVDNTHAIELDVENLINSGKYYCAYDSGSNPMYLLGFQYAEGGSADPDDVPSEEEPAKPFLSIALNGVEIEADRISYKGIFELGDYHKDEQQEVQDAYDYVHQVPYYHVTVPCGTGYVDVTYSADTNILVDSDAPTARGYVTDLEVDATTSATVRGYAFTNGYTQQDDGTQTVKTPVKGFTFNEEGKGRAVTLEQDGGKYEAICLFTFAYDKENHVYEEKITRKPCVQAGEKTYTCSCGDTYTETLEAIGSHVFENGNCTACGAEDPDFHKHSYDAGEVTTQPGCVSEGVKTFTCGCGDSYTEPVPAVGHSYGEPVEVAASCAAQGSKTWTCNNCDKDTVGHTKTEFTPKLDHTYSTETVTKEATCTEDGVKTLTCSVCEEGVDGHTKTEPITKLGHDYQNGVCGNCGDECPELVDGVYQIGSGKQLLWFANAVNGGDKSISGALTADITLDASWPGIGTSGNKFAGSFDGRNHTVTFSGSTYGLFAYTMGTYDSNGNAKQVAIVKNVITAGSVKNSALIHDGGYTHISNCINKADVTGGTNKVAGILGNSSGYSKSGQLFTDVRIDNCGNEGQIRGGNYAGGILGWAQSNTRLNGCYNTGSISGSKQVGGIAGFLQQYKGTCEIVNCYNSGSVSGSTYIGGICGQSYANITIANCYNAGECDYGITGQLYSKSIKITNCYYQGTKSDKGVPDNSWGISATAVTAIELSSAEFADKLGTSFKQSCPAPVLTWQDARSHTGLEENGICEVCGLGGNTKETYNVVIPTGTGYEVGGEPTATQDEPYTFTVTISEGYRPTSGFKVTVNGEEVYESNGTYTWEKTEGPLTITVEGVEKIPAFLNIILPNGEGKGYRAVAETAGDTTVKYDGTFRFKINIQENFRKGGNFQVLVNDSQQLTPDEDGWYALTNVQEHKTITVKGVEAKPYGDTADILLTITKGETAIYKTPEDGSNQMMLQVELQVPYFDISLYGLDCYYNPDCYGYNEDGTRKPFTAGNAESAYGVITPLHAFIYATEVHYLGKDPSEAGTGLTYQEGTFQKAISWTGGVGSIFMKLWDHGTNLNYYVNYEYPLGLPKLGSTSDQIALHDGDTISAHMIMSGEVDDEGNGIVDSGGANGSAYGIFVVNDADGQFSYENDTIHSYEAKQGDEVDLTLFSSVATSTYDTAYTTIGNQQLYWIHDDYLTKDMTDWNEGEGMVTDGNGRYILDTSDFEPGIYYIGAMGGFVEGDGKADDTGFISAGYERGVTILKLTITEGEGGTEEPSQMTGDMNGDGYITADDAATAFAASVTTEGLTQEQIKAADVTGDGYITADDAALIFAMSKGGAN